VARTIRIDSVRVGVDGQYALTYTLDGVSGHGTVYGSQADALALTMEPPDDANMLLFALRYWLGRDSDWSNPSLITGKTLTVDFSAAQPIRVI